MRSDSSRTTTAALATASASPSSVTRFPRRKRSQSTCSSSWRRTASCVPLSAAATSLLSSIWRRALTGGSPLAREATRSCEALPPQGGPALAVGAPAGLLHRELHHAAHVLRA